MPSSREYLDFILEQLSELDDVTYRAMMGEYILYFGKTTKRRRSDVIGTCQTIF